MLYHLPHANEFRFATPLCGRDILIFLYYRLENKDFMQQSLSQSQSQEQIPAFPKVDLCWLLQDYFPSFKMVLFFRQKGTVMLL